MDTLFVNCDDYVIHRSCQIGKTSSKFSSKLKGFVDLSLYHKSKQKAISMPKKFIKNARQKWKSKQNLYLSGLSFSVAVFELNRMI